MNLLQNLSRDNQGEFKWIIKPINWNFFSEGVIEIFASDNTDFFQDPSTNNGISTAPLFYKYVNGDFIARVRVKPQYSSIYNGEGLMIYNNEKSWIKLCYENTDLEIPTIVSVATNDVSDDANGIELDMEYIYLKIIRKNDSFYLFYSNNIDNWHMVRFFRLKLPNNIKVGLEAQSPIGKGAMVKFTNFLIENKTVDNLRKGD